MPEQSQELDWVGLIVRFICGCLLGGLIAADAVPSVWLPDSQTGIRLAFVTITIASGVLSARYGDDFWHWTLRKIHYW